MSCFPNHELKELHPHFHSIYKFEIDVGYEYVNIDDCWSLMERNNVTGEIVEDPIRFPNGGLQAL